MTNKTQTADSLKFYLGQDVLVLMKDKRLDNTVITLDTQMLHHYSVTLPSESFSVYPILKTAEELNDGRYRNKFFQIEDESSTSPSLQVHYREITFDEGIELIKDGYGAIPDKESHTGYSEWFGMPCVTPKMVEDGVSL